MNTRKNLLVEAVRNQGCPLMQGKALARIREAGLGEQRTQKSGNGAKEGEERRARWRRPASPRPATTMPSSVPSADRRWRRRKPAC